jgi:glycosyltransferase involved in cell wall biosynthesis
MVYRVKKESKKLHDTTPVVSVVLPVYNGERYLEQSIQSVLDQTFSDWELILVDDCSTDRSREIMRRFADLDARIRYVRNSENLNLPKSLNYGFSLARGQFHTWTSDDNFYLPHTIGMMAAHLRAHDEIGLVCAGYKIVDENDNTIHEASTIDLKKLATQPAVGACFLYRSEIFQKLGGYRHEYLYVEDHDFWLRARRHFEFSQISGIHYVYRVHSNALGITKRFEQYEKHHQLVLENLRLAEDIGRARKASIMVGLFRRHPFRKDWNCVLEAFLCAPWAFPFFSNRIFRRAIKANARR